MSFTLQPVRIGDNVDEEGTPVFDGRQQLVAVLTRLFQHHDDVAARWLLEASSGRLDRPSRPTFSNMEAGEQWPDERLRQVGEE